MNERAKLSGRSLRTLQSPVIRPKLHRGNSLDTSQTSSKRELSSEFTKWDWLDLSDRSMFYCSSNTSIFDSLSLELMSSGDEDEGEEDEDEDEDEEEGFQSRVGRRYGPLANQPIKSIRASSFYQSTTLPEFSKSFHRHTAKHQELRNNSGGSFRYRHRLANRLNDSSGAFTSSNVYIRPLPNSFSDQDLRALCFSVIRFRGDERTKFDILSVKVMVERSDDRFNGPCKGFGFCLWNSVEACARCIEGLRAEGYQASYAARLLRDRDDEAVGTGTSRGVGFVRLETRATALHFVEVLHGMPIRGGANGGHLQCRLADSPAQKEWKRNFRFRGDENRDSGTDTSPNDVQSPEPVLKPSSNIKWPVKRENNKRHGHRPITFYPNSPAPSITSISLSQSVTSK
ncbi:expressed protein [Phakopsora pachyrhizi]|uniref:Expressed protein n=1 Tax=Phakopsora pachyrhizi TaxID=170000 RepID=A0AAV0BLN1_PHAPC|nr:expressed protein [Phakopsora pachyrhizi]CAH7688419.1 expressed protein [Phakopsora pachyrhizi]